MKNIEKYQYFRDYLDDFSFNFNYEYKEISDYKNQDINEWMQEYWTEMIYRYHLSCLATLLRTKKWLNSVLIAYKEKDYYLFCVALRGLIESCADSFYTFGKANPAFATNKDYIEKLFSSTKIKEVRISTELENELIHFIFARKLGKDEQKKYPEAHQAEQVRRYLKVLNNDKVLKVYSHLCQISHPSFESINIFLKGESANNISVSSNCDDSKLITNLWEEYEEVIGTLINHALTPAICGLRLINLYKVDCLIDYKLDERLLNELNCGNYWEELLITLSNKKPLH